MGHRGCARPFARGVRLDRGLGGVGVLCPRPSGHPDVRQMMTRLQRIATYGQDARLSEAPYRAKTTGRALPVITVGHGPRTIFITAMQHANEYRVSDAAVDIAEKLSRRSKAGMRSALTVVIMPRVNIDGFDHTLLGEPWGGLPWRYNVDATAVGFTGPLAGFLAHCCYPFAI